MKTRGALRLREPNIDLRWKKRVIYIIDQGRRASVPVIRPILLLRSTDSEGLGFDASFHKQRSWPSKDVLGSKKTMKWKLIVLTSAASLLLHSFFAPSLTTASTFEHRLTEKARATHVITDPQQLAIAANELKHSITAPPPCVTGNGRRGIVISAGGEFLLSSAYVTAKVGTHVMPYLFRTCSLHHRPTDSIMARV